MKILVVDDSRANRYVIKRILEPYRNEIHEAANGLEALVKTAEIMPDIIIIDVVMPEMDGYDTCRFLANNPDTRHIPVIFLTSLDSVESLVKAFDAGAVDFIRKPPNEHELIARVHAVMRMKKYQDQLREMTIKDGLTGLYTHSYFASVLEREFYSVRRYDQDLGIIMFDLDNFKRINDTYGHIAGDKVLVHTAGVLVNCIRITDIPSRYGGEEFAVICPYSTIRDIHQVAERLRKGIERESIQEKEDTIHFTVSIGVTVVSTEDSTHQDMIRRADEALYTAKRTGKNKTVVRT